MFIEKKKSIRSEVYEQLKNLIVTGIIKNGEKIVELDYAKKFNVSRTPIREAIRMLELEGFVTPNGKGGVNVKEVLEVEVKEIYKIRIALEGILIEEIIDKNPTILSKIDKILDKTKKIINENNKSKEIISLFGEFNEEFYNLSKLTKISELIQNLNTFIINFRSLSIVDAERRKIALNEHLELISLIKKKDLENALKLNKKHLNDSMNFILKTKKKS